MEELKYLIYCVFVLSVLCGIYRLLSPKEGKTQTYLTFAVSLLSLSLFCAPTIQKIDFTLPDFQYAPSTDSSQNDAWDQALLTQSEKELETQYAAALCEKFGIPAPQCSVKITLRLKEDTITCESVMVTVTQNHAYLKKDMERYLENTLDCDLTVTVWEEST